MRHVDRERPQSNAPRTSGGLSTERIMQAVEQQRRITDQLVILQAQQQARIAPVRKAGRKLFLAFYLLIGAILLGLISLFVFFPDLFVTILASLSGVMDTLVLLAQYASAGLAFITRQNWLLAGAALAVVVLMGIWLRLMRAPREA